MGSMWLSSFDSLSCVNSSTNLSHVSPVIACSTTNLSHVSPVIARSTTNLNPVSPVVACSTTNLSHVSPVIARSTTNLNHVSPVIACSTTNLSHVSPVLASSSTVDSLTMVPRFASCLPVRAWCLMAHSGKPLQSTHPYHPRHTRRRMQ